MTKNYEFKRIDDNQSLSQYLDSLPNTIQMRFPAVTSFDRKKAIVFTVPDPEREHTLTVPYDLLKSHLFRKFKGFQKLTMKQMALNGLNDETGLKIIEMDILGKEIPVPNTFPGLTGDHVKTPILVKSFTNTNSKIFYPASKKIGPPVWLHNDLLPRIFEEVVLIKGEERYHPQREISLRYQTWLHSFFDEYAIAL